MSNKFLKSNTFFRPDYCSLYRAIRYIAFKEEIVKENIAETLYPKIFRFTSPFFDNEIFTGLYVPDVEFQTNENDTELFKEASRALDALLQDGKIKAIGNYSNTKGQFSSKEESTISSIRPILYECFKLINFSQKPRLIEPECWTYGLRDYFCSTLTIQKFEPQPFFGKFINIQIKTEKLIELFSNHQPDEFSNVVKTQKGRKEKGDWKKTIVPEIVKYFSDGADIKKSGAYHASEIYSLCSAKFGEENTPEIETLRTEMIGPVLRRLRFEEN